MDARQYFASDLYAFPRSRIGANTNSAAIALSTVGQFSINAPLVHGPFNVNQGLLLEYWSLRLQAAGGTSASQLFQYNGVRIKLCDAVANEILHFDADQAGVAANLGQVTLAGKPNLALSFLDMATLKPLIAAGAINNTGVFSFRADVSFLNTDAAGTLIVNGALVLLYRLLDHFSGGD